MEEDEGPRRGLSPLPGLVGHASIDPLEDGHVYAKSCASYEKLFIFKRSIFFFNFSVQSSWIDFFPILPPAH